MEKHELFKARIDTADEEQVIKELCKLYILEVQSPNHRKEWKEKIQITRDRLYEIIIAGKKE